MHAFIQDVRYSARSLSRAWGFTAVAIGVLALGIGATTTAFSLVNAVLLRPLNGGGSDAGGLVRVYSQNRVQHGWRGFSYPNYRDIRDDRRLFADLAADTIEVVGVGERDSTRPVYAAFVTSNYFSMLRVSLARGRGFTPADEEIGAAPVTVVSHAFWASRGSDPNLVGQTITIGARPCTVVGVAPEAFTGTMAVISPSLWLPMSQLDGLSFLAPNGARRRAALLDRSNHQLGLVGRLAPGVTLGSAAPRLEVLSRSLEQAHPAENLNQALIIAPNSRTHVGTAPLGGADPFAITVFFLLALATVLLLIAALNVANMLLARGRARQREIAIRLAIGAGRASIVRLVLVEAAMLSLAGGVGGVWIAAAAGQFVASAVRSLFPSLGIVFSPLPDGRVVVATLGFCAIGTAVFGLGPAIGLSHAHAMSGLRQQVATPTGRRRYSGLVRHGLVALQIALSLAMLTAGGLFGFGAIRAATADPGFSLDGGVIAAVDSSFAGFDEARSRVSLSRALARVRSLPGVVSASVAHTAPYGERNFDRYVQPAGSAPGVGVVNAQYRVVGADYFHTLGMPMLRGREFTPAEEESPSSSRPVIVDSEFARRMWPGQDPIGRQVQWAEPAGGGAPSANEVVGVVPSLKVKLFDAAPRAHIYVPSGDSAHPAMMIHVRMRTGGATDEAAACEMVAKAIRAADPMLPIVSVKTLRQHRDAGYEVWFVRLSARIFAVLGLVALLVAGVGLYGVRAFLVSQRTREFGIRIAIGASPGAVMRLVLAEGARLTAVGLTFGLLLAAGVSRLLSGWVYGVSGFGPAVLAAMAVLLAVPMLLACYLPARRALAVAPVTALRHD